MALHELPMWRWEKYNFAQQEVHVSCPLCFALTRAPIHDMVKEIPCSKSDCTFMGPVRYHEEAQVQYQQWKAEARSLAGVLAE